MLVLFCVPATALELAEFTSAVFPPYPKVPGDTRLPHIVSKLTKDIKKTALGAEETIEIIPYSDIYDLINQLKVKGISVVALEQTPDSIQLGDFELSSPISLLMGREVEGIDAEIIQTVLSCSRDPYGRSKRIFQRLCSHRNSSLRTMHSS